MSNDYADKIARFTRREDDLKARAKAVGLDLNKDLWRRWHVWFGDSERYLNKLRETVEDAEAQAEKAAKLAQATSPAGHGAQRDAATGGHSSL